jgi:hypothetical protein
VLCPQSGRSMSNAAHLVCPLSVKILDRFGKLVSSINITDIRKIVFGKQLMTQPPMRPCGHHQARTPCWISACRKQTDATQKDSVRVERKHAMRAAPSTSAAGLTLVCGRISKTPAAARRRCVGRSPTGATRDALPVERRNTHREKMSSAVAPITDMQLLLRHIWLVPTADMEHREKTVLFDHVDRSRQ